MTPSDLHDDSDSSAFDPNSRRLCPDGACIGVLGDDARCKVCGISAPDTAFTAGSGDEEQKPAAFEAAPLALEDGFDPGRRLCPDGACIGVLGDDARCKVCGRGEES
jgi:hypothetical protein